MNDPTQRKATILVVEDDGAMRSLLVDALSDEGYRVLAARGGREGLRLVQAEAVDVVVTDLRMPDLDGLDVVRELRARPAPPDVITITAFGTIDTAIKAMKLGAVDYITKPFTMEQLLLAVERALRERGLRQELTRLREAVTDRHRFASLIGRSAPMQQIFELIRRVADNAVTVLITGESGTGKELVARALHSSSSRAARPFIPVNCAAIPETLLEAELFGYKRGAFTDATTDRDGLFQEAEGGTIFFDEIGELGPALQAKLLRVMQEREIKPLGSAQTVSIDVRVVSATHRNLEEMMRIGAFRSDLYYRLNVVQVALPPLRDRAEDILPLATHLLRQAAARVERNVDGFSPPAARALLAHRWPGNVRELENVIERAVALTRGEVIDVGDLPDQLTNQRIEDVTQASARSMTLAELERAYILQVLDEEQGNKSRAAQRLGLDRKTLYRRLDEYRQRDRHEGES